MAYAPLVISLQSRGFLMQRASVAAAIASAVIIVGGVATVSSAQPSAVDTEACAQLEQAVVDKLLVVEDIRNRIRDAAQAGNNAVLTELQARLEANPALADEIRSRVRDAAQAGNNATVDQLQARWNLLKACASA